MIIYENRIHWMKIVPFSAIDAR